MTSPPSPPSSGGGGFSGGGGDSAEAVDLEAGRGSQVRIRKILIMKRSKSQDWKKLRRSV